MSETKKENLSKWQNRIAWTSKALEPKIRAWKENQRIFEMISCEEDELMSSLPFSTLFTLLSSLFVSLPKIIVVPKNPAKKLVMEANLLERVILDIWQKTDFFNVVFQNIYSAVMLQVGFVKTGYYETRKPRELDEQEVFENFIEEFPEGTQEELDDFSNLGTNLSEDILDTSGVGLDFVHPKDILVDPEATTLEAAKWVIHRITMTRDEFEDEFGKRVKFDDIKGSSQKVVYSEDVNQSDLKDFLDGGDSDRAVIYEVWDKFEYKRYIVCEGYDNFLFEGDWPYTMRSYPFEDLSLIPRHDSIEGLSLLHMGKPDIDIINIVTQKQIDDVLRAKQYTTYVKGALDEDQLEKMNDAGNKEAVEVNDNDGIRERVTAPFPPDHYQLREESQRRFESAARVSAAQRQSQPDRKETATFHGIQAQSAGTLHNFYQRRIERFVEKLTEKIISLVKQFYDEDNFTYIADMEELSEDFLRWQGSDIGEYTFHVKAGSASLQDTGQKLQQLMQSLDVIMKAIPMGLIPNPPLLVKDTLMAILELQGRDPETVKKAFEAQTPPPGAVSNVPTPGGPASGQSPKAPIPGVPPTNVPSTRQTQQRQPTPATPTRR